MEEAENVLERLRRIDALQREQAPAAALLAEARELVTEAEAWLEVEPAGARTKTAVERCREALGSGEIQSVPSGHSAKPSGAPAPPL
jgi:hypothetical protein